MPLLTNGVRKATSEGEVQDAQKPFILEDLIAYKMGNTKSLPPFVISRERGFLPREDPMVELPAVFAKLESLLQRMTIHQPSGSDGHRAPGLLALGKFGDAVLNELERDGPEVKAVMEVIEAKDSKLIGALFRDYCFATSAYLLEPVDRAYRQTGLYAKGRNVLPAQLAVPLKALADALGHRPYMEYASSYALMNYRIKNENFDGPAGKYSFDNIELIRAFEDAQGSERGFILVHVEMVSYSGKLVKAAQQAMDAVEADDINTFEAAFEDMLLTYRKVNLSMNTMWSRSLPSDYMKFRSFIYGTGPRKMNAMFPDGVVYEGVENGKVFFARGESGANDNLVPLGDNLLEITAHMPDNALTQILREFRTYRPKTQQEYINHVEMRASTIGVRNFANNSARAKALYLLLVDQIREFRNRHWQFTRSYIIAQTNYDIATGGSPILHYLPSNLSTVLKVLDDAASGLTPVDMDELRKEDGAERVIGNAELLEAVEGIGKRAAVSRRVLAREVEKLVQEKDEARKKAGSEAKGRGMQGDDSEVTRGSVGCDGIG